MGRQRKRMMSEPPRSTACRIDCDLATSRANGALSAAGKRLVRRRLAGFSLTGVKAQRALKRRRAGPVGTEWIVGNLPIMQGGRLSLQPGGVAFSERWAAPRHNFAWGVWGATPRVGDP
jgi:hypothetical protein